jgi:hypothetical protein
MVTQAKIMEDTILTRGWIHEQQFIYGGDIEASELKKLFKDGKKVHTKSYYPL